MPRRRTAIALTVAAALVAGAAPAAASDATATPKLLPIERTQTSKRVVAKVRGDFPRAPKVRLTAEMKRDKVDLRMDGRTSQAGGSGTARIKRPAKPVDARFNGTIGTYENKVAWSLYYIDRYWSPRISGYRTPTIYAAMERYAGVYCNGSKLSLNNAWYCPPGNFIAWDTNFLRPYFNWSQGGDMAVAAILAHEWGHLTASQLRLSSAKLRYSYYQEVYADCQSGAFTADLRRQGKLDNLGVGDIQEVLNMTATIGDRPGTAWDSAGAHGSAEQRKAWWIYGFNYGPQACVNAVLS